MTVSRSCKYAVREEAVLVVNSFCRTGRFYHGLGNVKLAQGLHDESFNYYEKAQKHYKVTLGRQHHRSADVAVSLGIHHARHGEDDKAL
jgi:Tetratricopeptide repeat